MPCACRTCLEHSRTLGLGRRSPTKAAIRKAFRSEAKLWHPDRFENDRAKRSEAEEHFKQIQVAYRELWEHCESPIKVATSATASTPEQPAETASTAKPREDDSPALFFGGAPKCFIPPHFPPIAAEIVLERRMEATERPHAIIDLSRAANFDQYIFLTNYRLFVRNAFKIVAVLWYSDLGDVRFVDLRRHGKPGLWRMFVDEILALDPKYALEIYRRNGDLLHSIADEADDSVKKVLYNFLLQKKSQTRS
jgi:hypothetical protein